ncbi:hypothetical protein FAZ15_01200 [Sphingobacterium olei]|uniref:DUF2384 domain-containing protein n=1 Tax=Sphingobacterium olei TaxID=2571155 RepID=A0A4V5MN12_9SPHI|nr:hypothetical protein [Sphingobacterium olei]TJZ62948.1 hypothetical protein FAZ15_01200 [Sphingobacterium olei]
MNRLEQYFDSNGSKAWDTLVKLATETSWTNSESQKILEQILNNHTDIAKVLYARLGEESINWIYRKVPALDGMSPLECLETPELIKRLKEGLSRMDI